MDIGQAVYGTKGIPDVTHDLPDRVRELEAENKRLRDVFECAKRVRRMFDASMPNELLVAHDNLADSLDTAEQALKGAE